jgi:hypothetical protein
VNRTLVQRERHMRAFWYAAISFALAVIAYLLLNFDQMQAFGYAVSCFVMLNVVNFRAMFAPLPPDTGEEAR